MTTDLWVQREAEALVRGYERVGLLSPQQCGTLVGLIGDGDPELALHLLGEFIETARAMA